MADCNGKAYKFVDSTVLAAVEVSDDAVESAEMLMAAVI